MSLGTLSICVGPFSTYRSCLTSETVCQRGGPYQVVELVGVEKLVN